MILLDDDQMRDFIVNGYVAVKTGLPVVHHQRVCAQLDEMLGGIGNLGNNVLPLIPEIQKVFDDPAVRGALTSVLGQNYLMHPHRYCHLNAPGSDGQQAHKDTYEGEEQVKRHRCRWVLVFYYPQNTTADMGASAVLSGTQYYETADAARTHPEKVLCGEAGTVVIAHYDLWHRATANTSTKKRYMLKFLLTRQEEPSKPTWHCKDTDWRAPQDMAFQERQEALWRSLWEWNCGRLVQANGCIVSGGYQNGQLMDCLDDRDEVVGINAAYILATNGDAIASDLVGKLRNGGAPAWRHAMYSLGAMGVSAVDTLTEALGDPCEKVRIGAAFALGDTGLGGQKAISSLTGALADESAWVRRHAVEALGHIGAASGESTLEIAQLLDDEHEWVRDNVARALAKIGPAAGAAVSALVRCLQDDSRYVRFHAGAALRRIDTAESREVLLDHLMTARWCPLTTIDSRY